MGICVLGCWRCFANNYLHWAATCTWLLLNLEGNRSLALLTPTMFSLIAHLAIILRRIHWRRRRFRRSRVHRLVHALHNIRSVRDAAVAIEVVHDCWHRISDGPSHRHQHCENTEEQCKYGSHISCKNIEINRLPRSNCHQRNLNVLFYLLRRTPNASHDNYWPIHCCIWPSILLVCIRNI